MSGPVETSIRTKISSKLSPEHLDVINESYMHNVPKEAESHFKVVVVSSLFENKPLIQRHRMVNEALSEEFDNGLHALSIVAKTPSQWADSDKKLFHSDAVIDFGKGAYGQGFYSPTSQSSSIDSTAMEQTSTNVVRIFESVPVDKQELIVQLVVNPEMSKTKSHKTEELLMENKCKNLKKTVKCHDNKESGDYVDACGEKKIKPPTAMRAVSKEDNIASCKTKEKNEERKIDKTLNKIKDGNYFLKILDEKVKVLEEIAVDCEGNIDLCNVEESKGELRSVAGKARLLVCEKFNQFRGLCNKNLSKSVLDTYPTTNEDLQGFWDMISLQFDEIMNKYETAKMMKENDWKMPQRKINKVKPAIRTRTIKTAPLRTIQPIKPPQPIKNKPNPLNMDQSEITKAREAARRKMLMDCKLAMKQVSTDPTI